MGKKELKKATEILKKYRENLLVEMNCLDHVLECGSLKNYDFMIDLAIKKGFKRVVDIGCAYGHQGELCEGRIEYVAVDEDFVDFYKMYEDNYYYSVGKYPFYIPFDMYKKDLAISNLAIGWQCYVNEEEFKEQCAALANDFKACLLYVPTDREKILKEYFKKIEIYKKSESKFVPTAFYYCYN